MNKPSVLEFIDSSIFTPAYANRLPLLESVNITKICDELFYTIKAKEPVFIYGDYDMDGFCASQVWGEVLGTLYSVPPFYFTYAKRTHSIDISIVEQAKKSGARVVLILDTGSGQEDRDVISMLRSNGHVPIVIDHHVWYGDYTADSASTLVFNSYEEKILLGGAEISGAYASLLVAYILVTKYFKQSLSYNAMVYALASMYSDVVDLATPPGRALYNMVSSIQLPGPTLFSLMNEWDYVICKRLFSFIIAPKFNACFRTEHFTPLNKALCTRDRYKLSSVVESLKEVHNDASSLTRLLKTKFTRETIGDICLCVHSLTAETELLHIRNFTGLIANSIAQEEKSMVIVVIFDGKNYSGSYRDFYNRKMLDVFKLFCDAMGHDAAFGLNFRNLSEFKRHLSSLSSMLDLGSNQDYTVLSSSLIGSKDDVQILSLYNEYMNVRPKIVLNHRCPYAKTKVATKWRKFYDVGLPYDVSSKLPLIEGSNILIEPSISRNTELRCVE